MRRLTLLLIVFAFSADATIAGPYHSPRTRFGTPDLQGLWTNSALTFLQRPPIFKSLIATDKEEAMMINMFKKMAGDIVSRDPIDPRLPAPPIVKEAPQADYLEMDLRLGRIDGQPRSSWIIEPRHRPGPPPPRPLNCSTIQRTEIRRSAA